MRRFAFPSVAVLALLIAVAGFVGPDDDYFAIRKSITLFGRLYEELATGYVDAPDAERLMRVGMDAMLASTDPYTVLFDEAATEDMEIQTRGQYGGVGISVGQRAGRMVVTAVLDGSSAAAQGIRPGDEVLSVEGQALAGRDAAEVLSVLRGAPGSTVALEVRREGEAEPLRFALVRSSLRVHDVTYAGWVGDPAAGVGYVRLERFSEQSAAETRAAIERLRDEGAANGRGLRGLVLDLRGNPGGLLDQAVDIAGLFLPQNTPVVTMRGRTPETERAFRNRNAPVLPDVPLAVLVDGESASASEVVAGALQDHDRAIIVGERTFGKGLVQQVRPLPYHTALKLTVARYYTPSGRCIQAVRYLPDGSA
ncbi:MAG TPA: S41 family peptidase, partial [Rhodothermales bacterium]|nr:S41 family peptidase [Rhodothermales bacterium]